VRVSAHNAAGSRVYIVANSSKSLGEAIRVQEGPDSGSRWPRADWADGKRRITVALVEGHFGSDPVRQFDLLLGVLQFDLRHHQTAVAAVEHVDFPGHAAEIDLVARLADERFGWKPGQQSRRPRKRHRPFELGTYQTAPVALDRQESLIVPYPDTGLLSAVAVVEGDIALHYPVAMATEMPDILADKEPSFDLE